MPSLSGIEQADTAAGHSAATPSCASCGAARTGPYCARCGQRFLARRHTVGSVLGGGIGRMLDLERGFFPTAVALTHAPGRVVRDYLAGRTLPYSDPFGYLLITFAAFALLSGWLPGVFSGGGGPENRFFTLLLIPFVAAVSRLLFHREGLKYAEHLAAAMFLCGHVVLLFTLALPFSVLVEPAGPLASAIGFGSLTLAVGYFCWAFSRIFRDRPVLAALGGLLSLVGGLGVGLAAVLVLVRVLQSLGMDG